MLRFDTSISLYNNTALSNDRQIVNLIDGLMDGWVDVGSVKVALSQVSRCRVICREVVTDGTDRLFCFEEA